MINIYYGRLKLKLYCQFSAEHVFFSTVRVYKMPACKRNERERKTGKM